MRWYAGLVTVSPRRERSSLLLPLVAGVILSGIAGYVGWTLGRDLGAEAASQQETPAILSEFRLPSIDGHELGPDDFPGQVVLVDFWATWCSPCKVQARILQSLWQEYRGRGVQFLAVSLGEERDTVEEYVESNPYPYPVLYDTADRIATQAEIYALPTVMVLDPERRVAYLQPGLSDANTLREAVDGARR